MHRMLSVGSHSWNIVTINSFLILFHFENNLSSKHLVTIKQRNKGPRGLTNYESKTSNPNALLSFSCCFPTLSFGGSLL